MYENQIKHLIKLFANDNNPKHIDSIINNLKKIRILNHSVEESKTMNELESELENLLRDEYKIHQDDDYFDYFIPDIIKESRQLNYLRKYTYVSLQEQLNN